MMKVPLLILLIGLLGLIATPLWAAHSHCKIDEKIVFSCLLEKSKKIISICASSNFSVENGYLQYRFGKQDKIELTLPASKHKIKPSSQTIRAKSLMFSGGGGVVTYVSPIVLMTTSFIRQLGKVGGRKMVWPLRKTNAYSITGNVEMPP